MASVQTSKQKKLKIEQSFTKFCFLAKNISQSTLKNLKNRNTLFLWLSHDQEHWMLNLMFRSFT